MAYIDTILVISAIVILISILLTRVFDKLGVPALLLFLGIGMLAGSEGPGKIYFDNALVAQSIGIAALVYILFSAGLDTRWSDVRPVLKEGVSLATFGVVIVTALIGVFTYFVLHFSFLEGLLLGAVISSTDAAAVFLILRSREIDLKPRVRSLLELESGSNDPMAVFLTVGLIQLLQNPETSVWMVILQFLIQMILGGVIGFFSGRGLVYVTNHLRIRNTGIYPVFVLASVALVYGITAQLHGSGFLAVYIAGIIAGDRNFIHKRSVLQFFDGFAWLSQIVMFLTLGLLVFPSQLIGITGRGILVSLFLILVARPVSVFLGLSRSDFKWREKGFLSWVGLRGSVPIILATFPLLAHLPKSGMLFNLVFFIVLTSVLLQGWTVPFAARLFGILEEGKAPRRASFEIEPGAPIEADLVDMTIPRGSALHTLPLVQIGFPEGTFVVLVGRNEQYFVPTGTTVLLEGDLLLMLIPSERMAAVKALLSQAGETRR